MPPRRRLSREVIYMARKAGEDRYMMRSEKRQSYNRDPRRHVVKKKCGYGFGIAAVVLAMLVWPVGMVMLCGHAVGQFASYEQAAEALVKRVGTIEPDMTYRAEYDDKYEQYKRMYAAAKNVYGQN